MTQRAWTQGVVLAAVLGGAAAPAEAQLAVTRSNERVLVLAPVHVTEADSAFAVQLGDLIRSKFDTKMRLKLRVIAKERICETLQASGFGCNSPLDGPSAAQLARAMQSDAYIGGMLRRNSNARVLHLRLVDVSRSGIAGWVTVPEPQSGSVDAFANAAVDSLDAQVRAAESARECLQRVERSDFRAARDRAERAFGMYPNHPTAAMCLSRLFEATRQPSDSQIFALQKAVRGDSLNLRAWERLGREYQSMGDTVKAAEAFTRQLDAAPADLRLRTGVAALWITLKQYQRAVDILDRGLERNALDLQMLQLKARACVDGELWACALHALAAQYEVDTALVGDSIFYAKVFGAAQITSDTAAMLKWSAEAVRRVPQSVSLWRARAAALKTAGRNDSAVVAYERIIRLDSTDVTSMLAASQILVEGMVIDSLAPLDTARLARADSLLTRAAALTTDPNTRANVAALFFNPGARLVQAKRGYMLAAPMLEKALANDVTRRVTTQANFFLGLAYFFYVVQTLDAQVREAKSCDLVEQEARLIARAREAMTAGQSVSPQTASQILPYLRQVEGALPSYRQVFKCS